MTPTIIIGIRTNESADAFDRSMRELKALCEAAELEVISFMTQTLDHPDNAIWLGSGKAGELSLEVESSGAVLVVCLGNLSPAQLKNLQRIIHVQVWDRTNLILEIFSRRARTKEARLQVEAAYLQYMLPRLTGMWQHLGRQGGGGGSRANKGEGEKQIELDRRQISHRITELKKELAAIDHTRDVQRQGRRRDNYPQVALVGYTNAGKSTLMNYLIGMSKASPESVKEKLVFEKDMLFATLDTSIRKIDIPDRKPFLLSDTVGFIEDIPHDLIKAFRSTLSELKYADVLLIVIDSSDENLSAHQKVTEDTLRDLKIIDIPRIYVYNKADLRSPGMTVENNAEREMIYVSASTGYGINNLLDSLEAVFRAGSHVIDVIIPYTSGDLINRVHKDAVVMSESYEEGGIHIVAECDGSDKGAALLAELGRYDHAT